MSREEIIKALKICTETNPKEDCSEECPYIHTYGCIRRLLNDTFEMVRQRIIGE